MQITLSISLVLLCLLQITTSAKILVLFIFSSKSHTNFATPIVNELANRGHDVVFVSPYEVSDPITKVKYVNSDTNFDNFPQTLSNKFDKKEQGLMADFYRVLKVKKLVEIMFEKSFSNKVIQAMVSSNETYDLILVNGFRNEFSYGWIHKLQVPVVMLQAGSPLSWTLKMTGNPITVSHLERMYFNSEMARGSFYEKVVNTAVMLVLDVIREYHYIPMVDQIVKSRFSKFPGVTAVEKNISLVLSNTHLSINGPRPYLPLMVEAGGVHCRPAGDLPEDLAQFVEGSGVNGFILFSFGSVVRASQMPENTREMFLDAFSGLPQRVLWKWETDEMVDGLPKNVKLSKWLPQQDLLGHPKCRAFITHGGLLSTQEAVYHGVPLVGIPFFGDQDVNTRNAEQSGYGIRLDLTHLTPNLLRESLERIITQPKFKTTAVHLSTLFRDQLKSALDRSVYWIEYVIRHKGAPHLKPTSAHHHWLQNLLLDVLAFIAVVIIATFIVILLTSCLIFKLLCKIMCRGKDSVDNVKKRQ